jgi:hypothetical protein
MTSGGGPEDLRLFTVDEVNALIPVLRDGVEFMQERARELDGLNADIARAVDTSHGNGHSGAARLNQLRRRAMEVAGAIERKIADIRAIGGEVKGIEQGLVDFPSLREGRIVYLCWRLGEDEVAWWHEVDAGFAGRQRL